MGCDKVCQAKKQAAEAQKQADAAKQQATNVPKIPGVPALPTTINVITVADVLGQKNRYQALLPTELIPLLISAKNNALIQANATVKAMITPIQIAFSVWEGYKIAQLIPPIVKPAVKIAEQINDIILLNFAALGTLLADVSIFVLAIFAFLTPLLLKILKDIFFTFPLALKILNKKQLTLINIQIELKTIELKNAFVESVNDLNPFDASGSQLPIEAPADPELSEELAEKFELALQKARDIIYEDLQNKINEIYISLADLPDINALDPEEKLEARAFINAQLEAAKKLELIQAELIIENEFFDPNSDENDVLTTAAVERMLELITAGYSPDDAFLTVTNEEIEKKKKIAEDLRDTTFAYTYAEDIIISNQTEFVNNIKNAILDISDLSINELFPIDYRTNIASDGPTFNCLKLYDYCYQQSIDNQIITEKSTIITTQEAIINGYAVIDTEDMEELVDLIYNNIITSVDAIVISVGSGCTTNYQDSICKVIDCFKNTLYSEIKTAIYEETIDIRTLPNIPSYIDKAQLKSTLTTLLNGIKDGLLTQVYKIIIDETIPCKSCRPCATMVADLSIYINNTIIKIKDNIKDGANKQINNSGLDWTITDAQSIIDAKNALKAAMGKILNQSSNELNILEEFCKKLEAERIELLKNISLSLEIL